MNINKLTHICTISGPSGGGKSTLVTKLVGDLNFHQMKNWTTRPSRGPHDTDYEFCSDREFDNMKKSGKFISLRETGEGKYGLYGPERQKINIAIVDNGGVQMIRDRYLNQVSSIMVVNFLLDTPREVCIERIHASGGSSVDIRLNRLGYEFGDDDTYNTNPIDRSSFITLDGRSSIEELKKTTTFLMERILKES